MTTRTKGFTLIELLVVISIVSLLAGIILASISSVRSKGKVAAGQEFSGQIRRAMSDSAQIFLDFNVTGALTANNIIANEQGELPISNVAFDVGTALVSDSTLYKRGYHLSVPTSGANPLTFTATGIGAI